MAKKQYIERDTCRDVLMRFLNSPCIQCGDYPSIMSVETCIKLFDSVPAADVVPRAVIAEIFADLYERLSSQCSVRSFEDAPCTTHRRMNAILAELKKKYTEE